jgi:protein-tyrosine phosphatase
MTRAAALVVRLRRWYEVLRHLPDRLRHDERHAAVRRRLLQIGRPRTVLVVCAGNICRSPYLEAVLKRRLPDVSVASAGFTGFNRPVAPHALTAAAKRGIDLSSARSNLLQPHRARTADLVLVMDVEQARYLASYLGVPRTRIIVTGDLDPVVAPTRTIRDPWQESIEVFESTFDRLDRCAETLSQLLERNSEEPARVDTAQSIEFRSTARPSAATAFGPN